MARTCPRRIGYWLSRQLTRRLSRRRVEPYRIVRDNLTHVLGASADDATLDEMAANALNYVGRTYFDMFRARTSDYHRGRVTVRHDADAWGPIREEILSGERGTVLVGPHMSNFDLIAQWFAAQGLDILGLSLSDPTAGDRVVNWSRRKRGVQMTPIGVRSLRHAVVHLRRGGVVLTGVDRPVSPDDEQIAFFGRPARLPVGHVRLALQTNARLLVACAIQEPDGQYALVHSPLLDMEHVGTRKEDIRHNARRVVAIVEQMIRRAPDQWLMFVPVWPDEAAG